MDIGAEQSETRPLVIARPLLVASVVHDLGATCGGAVVDFSCDSRLAVDEALTPQQLRELISGVLDRPRTAQAGEELLSAIRAAIPSKTVRDCFDDLFRFDGHWLHDSLEWVLAHDHQLRRDLAGSDALTIPVPLRRTTGQTAAFSAALQLGYLLYQQQKRSGDMAPYQERARAVSPDCLRVASRIKDRLIDAEQWFGEVLHFLLFEPWIADPDERGVSLMELLTRVFPPVARLKPFQLRVEACGCPDAYASENSSTALLDLVLADGNEAGRRWLEENSAEARRSLLTGLDFRLRGHVPTAHPRLRLLDWQDIYRSGVVCDEHCLRFDIGNPIASLPEIALHELMHLAYASVRPPFTLHPAGRGTTLLRRSINRVLDEGMAEFFSGRALASLVPRFPLLGTYRRLRFALLREQVNDPHITGYGLLQQHFSIGGFSDADDLLNDIDAAAHDVGRLLAGWGESSLPNAAMEGAMIAVPEIEIAIGAQPELRSVLFRRDWCAIGADQALR